MTRLLALLCWSLCWCVALVAVSARDETCVVADPNNPGYEYNLQPLMADTDYECDNTVYTSYYYKMNVCKAITTTSTNCAAGSTGVCELSHSSNGTTYVGGVATTPQLSGTQLVLQYPQGTSAIALINFTCAAGSGVGNPEYDHETFTGGIRYYYFTWTTEYACSVPVEDGGDSGSEYYGGSSGDESSGGNGGSESSGGNGGSEYSEDGSSGTGLPGDDDENSDDYNHKLLYAGAIMGIFGGTVAFLALVFGAGYYMYLRKGRDFQEWRMAPRRYHNEVLNNEIEIAGEPHYKVERETTPLNKSN